MTDEERSRDGEVSPQDEKPPSKGRYRPDGIDDAFAENRTSGAQPRQSQSAPGTIGFRGMLRFIWRQLTSMRVALMLLMLLAVAAVPGSLLPQRSSDPTGYARYVADHQSLAPWLDKLQLFDVYSSVWFAAIYLLLFVSLIGCITPRSKAHLRSLRAQPPRAPRRFTRLPQWVTGSIDPDQGDAAIERARRYLRGRLRVLPRYRVALGTEQDGARTIAAERGYLRETGNLVFHIALVGLLITVATGQMLHYRGQVLLLQGRGFANAEVHYDTFDHGAWFRANSLDPFTLHLDSFESEFRSSTLEAKDFTAHVTVRDHGKSTKQTIKVNHPLDVGGAKIYLQGNGYAPDVQIKDAAGNVAFSGPVPFLPRDGVYTSQGTIKVPDVTSGDQIGLVGYLLPTAQPSPNGWVSVYPEPYAPKLVLAVWHGDLGLDNGIPQNVYKLDTDHMTQSMQQDGSPASLLVAPGETVDLPDGLGTFTFTGVDRYTALDLRYDPTLLFIAIFAFLALAGLGISLFVPRRRVWLRLRGGEVEVGALARSEDMGLGREVRRILASATGEAADDDDDDEGFGPSWARTYDGDSDKQGPVGPREADDDGR